MSLFCQVCIQNLVQRGTRKPHEIHLASENPSENQNLHVVDLQQRYLDKRQSSEKELGGR